MLSTHTAIHTLPPREIARIGMHYPYLPLLMYDSLCETGLPRSPRLDRLNTLLKPILHDKAYWHDRYDDIILSRREFPCLTHPFEEWYYPRLAREYYAWQALTRPSRISFLIVGGIATLGFIVDQAYSRDMALGTMLLATTTTVIIAEDARRNMPSRLERLLQGPLLHITANAWAEAFLLFPR